MQVTFAGAALLMIIALAISAAARKRAAPSSR
jgi:hypothetical protein